MYTLYNKIESSTVISNPYPHIIIDDFFPKKIIDGLADKFPDYNEISDDKVIFQDTLHTKKSIVDNNGYYSEFVKDIKELETIDTFIKNNNDLKELLYDKFEDYIKKYSNLNKQDILDTSTEINISVSIPGYSKEIHVDRREHILNLLCYFGKCEDNCNLELWKSNEKQVYDVFPKKSDLKLVHSYKPKHNRVVITMNVPFGYHSVSKQENDFKNRKMLFVSWDIESGYDRKKGGNNDSTSWKSKNAVLSEDRRFNFMNLIPND